MKKPSARNLKMADSGRIEDPRVLRLMYVEKCINEAKLKYELKARALNDEIERAKQDRRSFEHATRATVANHIDDVRRIREELSADYDINMIEWGYDDTTGVLMRHPPEVLTDIYNKLALEKKQHEERHEANREHKEKALLDDKKNKKKGAKQASKEKKKQDETVAEPDGKTPIVEA